MFTGLVSGMGTIDAISGSPELATFTITAPQMAEDITIGDSIALSGVCMTVKTRDGDTFTFEAMGETLRKTTLGAKRPGDAINLEPSMRANTQMGGHIVSGHVDGMGEVVKIVQEDGWRTIHFRVPDTIRRLVSPKGAVTIDGTSLTIIDVIDRDDETVITIGLIPHTLAVTTHGQLAVGDKVNMEADMLARYVLRLNNTQHWAAVGAQADPDTP